MIKVASYCRVSTDRDDQANSFESQQRYFKEYIDRQPDWELYQVYADEGITGTSTKKRAAFNRMIADAHLGKFHLILTKEVSRFSRNILDTITYTRELKALGVGVLFMNDGISTLEPDAELRLSIMGSIAQEESRKTSTRVKWGQTRRMEQGVVFGRSLLGYDVKDGCLTVNPEGAEIVRLIFYKYGVEKKGTTVIARELREAGYRTHSGNVKWSNTHIVKILKNEKYVGDLVQKKTITPDYLSHAKKYNHGEEEFVIIRDHHEPIIDRELWDTVQRELKKRNRNGELGAGHSNRYVFSGKIKCGECGASFVSRKKTRKDGSLYKRWSCYTATSEGQKRIDVRGNEVGCDVGKLLRDELALDILQQSLTTLRMDRDRIIQNVTALALEAIQMCEEGSTDRVEALEYEISQLKQKKADVLDAFFSKQITKEEMHLVNQRYDGELEDLQRRLEGVRERESITYEEDQLEKDVGRQVADIVNCRADSEVLYKNVLDHMVVHKDRKIEIFLNLLPQKWTFVLENLRKSQNDPPVPISVSNPFSSA
ncbi:MAG: recombinase family protein [Dysosmobacter sp.]|nr:recombinase family protein [Dysosmobacter sp.]